MKNIYKIYDMTEIFNIKENIYITSDEEIKEGDWIIYKKFMFPLKVVLDQDGYHIINNGIGEVVGDYYSLQERYKKIIITTDQDLIKDGVQPIDDEFLEWLVKNLSCNSVEVIYEPKNYFDLKQGWEHLLIIPKEEPKQETLKYVAMTYWEAAIYNDKYAFKNGFIEGAKWQKEQDKNKYSEEEVEKISKDAYIIGRNNILIGGFNKWVEQFKNK